MIETQKETVEMEHRGREMDPQVTKQQIGTMTLLGIGGRQFVHDFDTLTFTISRGHRVVSVTLDFDDTYTVRTTMKRSGRVVFEQRGIYCDGLSESVWQSHLER